MAQPKTASPPLTADQMTKQPTLAGATKTSLADNEVFTGGQTGAVFGPGIPLQPSGDNPIRTWDFPVSINTVITPRAYETNFKTLRAYANIEIIRLCIETRKDQMEALSWSIKPKGMTSGRKSKAATDSQDTPAIRAMTKFWEKPNGYDDFATWLRESLEDLFVLDAPAWEKRRTRGGGINGSGKLIGLDVIPGDTIHPMVDYTGRRPRGPGEIAFQQVIKGRPWVNLTNDDILYAPRNPRPGHNYGLGPVEQIVVTINTIMRRQAAQLAYFTEGNTPAGLLSAPPNWTPEQIFDLQNRLDERMSGSTADQAKLLYAPDGTKYQAFKDAPLKDDFDEWLARIATFAFSLPPTAFIKQMNKGTTESDKERAQSEGLGPLKKWWKRVADGLIQVDLGEPNLEWAWDDDLDVDPAVQSVIDDRDLRNGKVTLDEVRDRVGLEAYANDVGAKPLIYTTAGVELLEEAIKPQPEPIAPVIGPDGLPLPPVTPGSGPGTPSKSGGKSPAALAAPDKPATPMATPKGSAVAKAAKSSQPAIDTSRPVARRATKALTRSATTVLRDLGDDVAGQVSRALRKLDPLTKAHDSPPDAATIAAAQIAQAAAIADAVNLDGLTSIVDAVYDDLFDVTTDSMTASLARIGAAHDAIVGPDGKLTDLMTGRVSEASVAYARARSAELVSFDANAKASLVKRTRLEIRNTIADGLADNIGRSGIAKALQDAYAFSPERAALIANTEISNANSNAVLESFKAARDEGMKIRKVWETVGDDDVSQDCELNEAQGPIDIDDAFQSGDDAPLAHPNCRCVLNSYTENSDGETVDEQDDI